MVLLKEGCLGLDQLRALWNAE
eukprot:SAG11_NODE_5739_length_1474_cov_1.315636_3_plen_21_part_01